MKPVSVKVASLGCALAALFGCAPPPSTSVVEAPIVAGVRETGYPAVYFLLHNSRRGGSSCTAALISPHVVLTARHCIVNDAGTAADSPDAFSLYRGTDRRSFGPPGGYTVVRAEIIPGSTPSISNGRATDVGILILADAADETPIPLARDTAPSTLIGMTGVAVGFGQQPDGNAGIKMRAMAPVMDVAGGIIYVDPTVCSGDSGGPLIGPDGRIYGVASFIYSLTMSEPVCGTAPGAYNEIYRHIEWINTQIESTGDACFPNPEICDGADNDCNGRTDEFCDPLGSACEVSSTCAGGLCEVTSAGNLCTQTCDLTRPEVGCAEGFYCSGTPGTCEGYCIPGSVGTAPLEAACASDADCASGVCRDPGDGSPRCVDPCRSDGGDCIEGQVCLADVGSCGICLAASSVPLARGLGEVCMTNDQCRSETCTVRNGLGECTSACRSGRCEDGFTCEFGRCIVRRTLPAGEICNSTVDCARGAFCASQGERDWCSETCSATQACPEDFECVRQGSVSICAPMAGIVGEACDGDAACVSGLCRPNPTSGRRTCTTTCSRDVHCSVGFTCDRLPDGSRGCFRAEAPAPPAAPANCQCALSNAPTSSAGLGIAAISVLAAVARRRRRLR